MYSGFLKSHALTPLLSTGLSGSLRSDVDSEGLRQAVEAGEVVMERVCLPFRPRLSGPMVDLLLAGEGSRQEGPEHRILKIHARILARALDPRAVLEPETVVTGDRFPLRADLVAWNYAGVRSSFECGSPDGRSVLRQLETGSYRVMVLPYAGLAEPAILALAFRWAGSAVVETDLTAELGTRVFRNLVEETVGQELDVRLAA